MSLKAHKRMRELGNKEAIEHPIVGEYGYGKILTERDYYFRPESRTDPALIQTIEELGEEANGLCATLKIIEIPDDIEFEIEEYDGWEWISEAHRKWY